MKDLYREVISYELDEYKLFKKIQNMNFQEYRDFRSEFLTFDSLYRKSADTEESRNKTWSRLLRKLKSDFDYQPPISMSIDAIEKRLQRKS
jgi:hypothetical protein